MAASRRELSILQMMRTVNTGGISRDLRGWHRNGLAESMVWCWEDRKAVADRSRECCGRAGPGQHPCPHSSALAQQACSGLSTPWWEGVSATTEPQPGEKNVLPALESWAVGARAVFLGYNSSRSCILAELARGCREEAALPTVEIPAKLQTCRTSPCLSAKSSQALAGGRDISSGLILLRGEQQVFCGVELVNEFLVVLGLQAQNVLKLKQVTVGVKGRKLGWVPRGVGGWLCPRASEVLPIPAVRAQVDLPLAKRCSTPQGAPVPFMGCHSVCSYPARFPSLQRLCSQLLAFSCPQVSQTLEPMSQ